MRMPTFRFYMNKTDGNEHSRVVDQYAADEETARAAVMVGADETVDSVVTLSWLQTELDRRAVGVDV